MKLPLRGGWENSGSNVPTRSYRCGFCDNFVAGARGWQTDTPARVLDAGLRVPDDFRSGEIRLCPACNQPSYWRHSASGSVIPGVRPGDSIRHLPDDVEQLYTEARDAHASGAFTASVLVLRKLLMHVAVEKDADEGLAFIKYVEYLDSEGYLGRGGKAWVDLIRSRSNEANHEIVLMEEADSKHLMTLAEMLLKLVYEFPGGLAGIPGATPAPAGGGGAPPAI